MRFFHIDFDAYSRDAMSATMPPYDTPPICLSSFSLLCRLHAVFHGLLHTLIFATPRHACCRRFLCRLSCHASYFAMLPSALLSFDVSPLATFAAAIFFCHTTPDAISFRADTMMMLPFSLCHISPPAFDYFPSPYMLSFHYFRGFSADYVVVSNTTMFTTSRHVGQPPHTP